MALEYRDAAVPPRKLPRAALAPVFQRAAKTEKLPLVRRDNDLALRLAQNVRYKGYRPERVRIEDDLSGKLSDERGGERRRPIAPAETGAEREHAAAVIILPQRRERVRGELSGSIARKRKRHGLVVFHGAYAPDRFRHAEIYEPRARAHRRARAEIRRAGIPDASADDEELSVIALGRFGSAPRHGHAAAIPVYAHGLRHIPVHGFHPLR